MKIIYLILLAAACSIPAQAQETLYWSNGSSFPFKLVEATESIVKVAEQKGERVIKRSVPRENVLVAFNARGDYLLVADLPADPAQAAQRIIDFYNAAGPSSDLLVQANPLKVIECSISYKSDNVVNYNTPQGSTASINRNELALIIFKDGHHEFVLPPADAASVLAGAKMQVQKAIAQPAKTTAPKAEPRPVAEKVAEPAVETATPAQRWNEPVAQTPAAEPAAAPVRKSAENAAPVIAARKGLTDEEVSSYGKKGIRKVDEFVQYLNIISDKNIDPDKKDNAIEQAVKLFLADATIEVSSSNREGKRKYPVKDYLTRLKLLPYSSTNIAWNEVNYVKDLTQASDGNYYGTITGSQTFTGYSANGQDVMYSDVTQKSVKVKLESYNKTVDGQQTTNWDILLGNVGISVNQ
ncbi:hypothetical protein DYBT9623_04502 [Dyadobacter sp. CECT 9623]|uniref:Uncharacterized protein n=1 Tax=Dyadobacter linearis TaxID=2823330 RepID=A0ABN7RGV7_9BACT|nr:hypothetical protein [Dyadobacter sp. CECT 9623]CAG5072969.1 hypothetical protein DYBT9623_04502 [Dyadobacter sp. CECT 9623]